MSSSALLRQDFTLRNGLLPVVVRVVIIVNILILTVITRFG
jgi:hypothetical protein